MSEWKGTKIDFMYRILLKTGFPLFFNQGKSLPPFSGPQSVMVSVSKQIKITILTMLCGLVLVWLEFRKGNGKEDSQRTREYTLLCHTLLASSISLRGSMRTVQSK